LTIQPVNFYQPFESFANGFRNQLFFALRLLLFINIQRLVETGVSFFEVIQEILYLQILASQAQNSYTSNIGMVCIGSEEFSQDRRILADPATSALVIQKFYSIDIFKNPSLR